MPKIPKKLIRLAKRAVQERLHHESLLHQTPAAVEASHLRLKGIELEGQGWWPSAAQHFEAAYGLFEESDGSPAAAAAAHGLATHLAATPLGIKRENLLRAERLSKRALACPERERDLYRAAMTRDTLGKVYRRLVNVDGVSSAESERYLNEALRLRREAVELCEERGVEGWLELPRWLLHLGNTLADLEDDEADAAFGQAGRATKQTLELIRKGGSGSPSERMALKLLPLRGQPDVEELESLLSATYGARSQLALRDGSIESYKRAQYYARLAMAHGDVIRRDEARIHLATAVAASGEAGERAEALRELALVRKDTLRPENRLPLARVHRDPGDEEGALALLMGWIEEAIGKRQQALADHVADHAAAEAQRLAAFSARIHSHAGRALQAFCLLESVSALRFYDELDQHIWGAKDAVSWQLDRRRMLVGLHASKAQEMVAYLSASEPQQQRKLLRLLASAFRGTGDAVSSAADPTQSPNRAHVPPEVLEADKTQMQWAALGDDRPEWHRAMDQSYALRLQSIAESSAPERKLKLFTEELRKEATELWDRVKARDPSFGLRSDLYDVTPAHLLMALCPSPGRVLLRLDVGAKLLLCAVWMEGEELKGWSEELDFDPTLISQVQRLASTPGEGPPDLMEETLKGLASVDLSPLLSQCPRQHLVLLPSQLAYLLPLAALGRSGHTLLDHFDGISWLPNLSPLLNDYAPTPPRHGQVTFTPGPTHFHTLAFKEPVPGEVRVDGPVKDPIAFREALKRTDVVSLYTHGRHRGADGPAISLGEGGLLLVEDVLGGLPWKGMERVELWCCESGVNFSSSPLTPHVDEMFGFDRLLLKEGVRSTIASLWAVPDLVTGSIVHRFRDALRAGKGAPVALASAQRWWRDEGVEKLGELLGRYPQGEAVAHYGDWLGLPLEGLSLEGELGPDSEQQQAVLERFRHPVSWAGFRLTGVCERRPQNLEDVLDRPLTPEEASELASLLGASAPQSLSIDEWQEPEMNRLRDEVSPQGPTTTHALRMARLYRERLASRHQHNVLAGLAWLHERLAHPELTVDDRQLLQVEAAHLWLDLAEAERVIPLESWNGPVFPGALERAEQLLHGAHSGPDVAAANARCQRLRIEPISMDPQEITGWRDDVWLPQMEKIWQNLSPWVGDASESSYAQLRVWMVGLDHLALAGEALASEALELLERLDGAHLATSGDVELKCAAIRMDALEGALRLIVSPRSYRWEPDPQLLPPWEGARLCFQELIASKDHKRRTQRARKRKDGQLQNREIMLYSYPGDGSADFFQASGTLGAAYRRLSGNILHNNAHLKGHDSALNLLAASQFHADLRLEWLNKVGGGPATLNFQDLPNPYLLLWTWMEARENIFQSLADVACGLPASVEGASARYARLDPFAHSIPEILQTVEGEPDQLAWILATATGSSEMNEEHGRTCAFAAIRSAERISERLLLAWKGAQGGGSSQAEAGPSTGRAELLAELEPQNRMAALEATIRNMDSDRVLVALIPAQGGFVSAVGIWKAEGQIQQRLIGSKLPIGRYLATLFSPLVAPTQPEVEPNPSHPSRGKAWAQLTQFIQPLISSVLKDLAKTKGQELLIFAPGPYRALPWGGLTLDGHLIRDQFSRIRHLPTLSFAPSPPMTASDRPYTACLLGGDPPADTPFGHATVITLRDWFPHIATEQSPSEGTADVPEGPIFGEAAQGAVNLRLYGESYGWPAGPASSSLGLSGRRILTHVNLIKYLLPVCNSAEIWGDTGGLGQLVSMKGAHEDRIPGLAHTLLANGAQGVLDLAWPIHDLVKALVCERYYIARWQEALPGADGLGLALAWTSDVLKQWAQAMTPDTSLAEALAWLDDARRQTAQRCGLDTAALQPYASATSVLSVSLSGLLEEVNQPHHLAAFRWWGK